MIRFDTPHLWGYDRKGGRIRFPTRFAPELRQFATTTRRVLGAGGGRRQFGRVITAESKQLLAVLVIFAHAF